MARSCLCVLGHNYGDNVIPWQLVVVGFVNFLTLDYAGLVLSLLYLSHKLHALAAETSDNGGTPTVTEPLAVIGEPSSGFMVAGLGLCAWVGVCFGMHSVPTSQGRDLSVGTTVACNVVIAASLKAYRRRLDHVKGQWEHLPRSRAPTSRTLRVVNSLLGLSTDACYAYAALPLLMLAVRVFNGDQNAHAFSVVVVVAQALSVLQSYIVVLPFITTGNSYFLVRDVIPELFIRYGTASVHRDMRHIKFEGSAHWRPTNRRHRWKVERRAEETEALALGIEESIRVARLDATYLLITTLLLFVLLWVFVQSLQRPTTQSAACGSSTTQATG